MYLRAFIPFVLHDDVQGAIMFYTSSCFKTLFMQNHAFTTLSCICIIIPQKFQFFVLFKCFYGKYFLKENNRCWWHSEIIIYLPSASKCIHYFLKRWVIFQRHSILKTLSLRKKISTVYTYFYGKLLWWVCKYNVQYGIKAMIMNDMQCFQNWRLFSSSFS